MASQTYVDGVSLSAAAEFNKFDTVAYSPLTGVAGTNTITATGPANYTLASRIPLSFIPAVTNTGATTLNITPSGGSALTAKNVFANGAACIGGELIAGVPAQVVYDGTQFNILGSVQRGSILSLVANAAVADATTNYMNSAITSTTEADVSMFMPFACTVKNMYCNRSAGGAGTATFTFRKNGVDTTLVAAITGAATTGNDTVNSVALAAGDYFSMKVVLTGGATTAIHKSMVEVVKTSA